jgi:hypothetical protein
MLGNPEDQLVFRHTLSFDAGRERIALGVREARSGIVRHDLVDAALVPVHRAQDDDGAVGPFDVAVEGRPEAVLLAGRNERVDEDDGVGALVIDTSDVARPALVAVPVGMRRRPAPETVTDLLDFHGPDPSHIRPGAHNCADGGQPR